MSSSMISHCRVAQESTYGSPDSDGIPSASGLTFKALELDRGGIAYAGEAIADDRAAEARCSPHGLPPEPDTSWSGGSRVQHRQGDVTLTVYPRGVGVGTAYPRPTDLPWWWLAATALKEAEAIAATDTVTGVTQSSFTATTPATWSAGQIVAVEVNGRLEFTSVVGISGATVTVSPALSGLLGSGVTARFCDLLYFKADYETEASVALEMMTQDARVLAFGCRATSIALNVEQGQLKMDITLACAHIREERPAGTVVCPDFADGARPHLRGSYAVYSAPVTGSAPISLARNVMAVDRDSTAVSITAEQVSTGYSSTLLAEAEKEVVSLMAEATLKLRAPDTAFDSDFWGQVRRNLLLGFGPGGQGNGLAVMMGGAFQKSDASKRSDDSNQWNQDLSLEAGLWEGDDDSFDYCNSAFRLGAVR